MKETFDIAFILNKLPGLLSAVPVTLYITALSLVFGWLAGLLLAWGKISKNKTINAIVDGYTSIMRGVPTILILFIVYFGIPQILENGFGIPVSRWSKYFFAIVALSIELSVQSSELFKSAYLSVDKGQMDAARVLGYSRWKMFIYVILPQGLAVITPNLGSGVLAVMQGSALVYSLGIFDILGKARQINNNVSNTKSFEMYFVAALLYWLIALVIDFVFRKIDKKSVWLKSEEKINET